MNKIAKIVLGATVVLAMGATTVSADVAKGQKLYMKKIKKDCGNMKASVFAGKHKQAEWDAIYKGGKLAAEIKAICPAVKEDAIKEKNFQDIYDFVHEYASDSGNVPSC